MRPEGQCYWADPLYACDSVAGGIALQSRVIRRVLLEIDCGLIQPMTSGVFAWSRKAGALFGAPQFILSRPLARENPPPSTPRDGGPGSTAIRCRAIAHAESCRK